MKSSLFVATCVALVCAVAEAQQPVCNGIECQLQRGSLVSALPAESWSAGTVLPNYFGETIVSSGQPICTGPNCGRVVANSSVIASTNTATTEQPWYSGTIEVPGSRSNVSALTQPRIAKFELRLGSEKKEDLKVGDGKNYVRVYKDKDGQHLVHADDAAVFAGLAQYSAGRGMLQFHNGSQCDGTVVFRGNTGKVYLVPCTDCGDRDDGTHWYKLKTREDVAVELFVKNDKQMHVQVN